MHCLYGGYNLHRFSDALGLVYFVMYGILFKSVRSKKEKKRNFNINLQNDSFFERNSINNYV